MRRTKRVRTKKTKFRRTRSPVKDCCVYLDMDIRDTRYFVDVNHYKESMVLMTKHQAYKLHKQLKKKYIAPFTVMQVKSKNGFTRTRILIKN